jgi:cell division protein FtsX
MLFAMAWRNLWRNPRRTLLTLAAVAGGLGLMIAMYGMTRAMGDRLIEGLTGSFMGHVQLHREGNWSEAKTRSFERARNC